MERDARIWSVECSDVCYGMFGIGFDSRHHPFMVRGKPAIYVLLNFVQLRLFTVKQLVVLLCFTCVIY